MAPDDIFGAQVQLEILKPVLGLTLVILFDEVMFLPEPSQSLSGWVALISSIGVARWMRRRGSRC